jgi:RNA polymerase sigma-70 factor (ECF subfamily)
MRSDVVDRDEDLALLRGNRAAQGALLSRHADAAYRFALRLCRRPADAEDVLQMAFLEVLRHAADFRGESSVKTWILGFVLNASRNKTREESRRRERQRAVEVRENAPDGVDPETADQVRQAIEDLPEHYRAPVWLHYVEGLSTAEIGAVLRLPADTVRKQLSRGIDRLREALLPVGMAGSVLAILPCLAVETAPPAIASGTLSATAKVGIGSKIAATVVAAIALSSTASALWWGQPDDDRRPPELAEIERRVREWQPTAEERRFDEIGWVPDLRTALRLSRESGRPVFLLTQSGRIHLGRSDGGSQFVRPRALADSRIIAILNAQYVPVYLSNADFERPGAAIEEERLRDRVWAGARKAGLPSGMDGIYLLDPGSAAVLSSSDLGAATPEALLGLLERNRKSPPGDALVAPAPQSVPPPAPAGTLTLHLTARYLDAHGRVEQVRPDFHEVPAEDWIVLGADEWQALLPAQGESREVPPAIARKLLTHVHPADISIAADPDGRNRFEEASLRAVRFSRSYVRLEGRLRMGRTFTQMSKSSELPVAASLKGVLEIAPDRSGIRSLRMISENASYGDQKFGVAVRSVP